MPRSREELNALTKPELYEEAKSLEIPGRSRMTKSKLMESIMAAEESHLGLPPGVPSADSPDLKNDPVVQPVSSTSSYMEPEPAPVVAPVEPYEGDRGPDLPSGYGVTTLKAMPRDPHWVYVYWEVSESDRDRLKREHDKWVLDRSTPIVKIVETETGAERQQLVLLDAGNWYLPVQPDTNYRFEIGIIKADGTFVLIAQSNELRTARALPSGRTDEEWAIVEERFQQLLALTGGFAASTSAPGSADLQQAASVVLRDVTHLPWSRFEGMSTALGNH